MAELTIRPEEIRDALEQFVQSYTPETAARTETGQVTETVTASHVWRVCPRR